MALAVLLDLSIGDNVDEAFALALACCSPELELLGVTTTYERSDPLVRLTQRFLGAYGRSDVPVAASREQLVPDREYTQIVRQHSQRFVGALAPVVSDEAVEFMASQVAHHGRVTLVATSALTNVAELLRRYPRIERHIAQVVLMGGWTMQALPEWNMRADPRAAHSVLQSRVPLKMIGYEVTLGCVLKQPYLEDISIFTGQGPRLLGNLYRLWSRMHGPAVLHDPLTIALLCAPRLIRLRRLRIAVSTRSGPGCGAIYAAPNGRIVDLAVQVDVPGYLDFVLSRLFSHQSASLITADPSKWAVRLQTAHRIRYFPGWRLSETASEGHILVLVSEGTWHIRRRASELIAGPGSVVYIPPRCPYEMEAHGQVEVRWLQFDVLIQRGWGAFSLLDRIPELPQHLSIPERAPLLLQIADRIVDGWHNPQRESALFCQAYLLELLAQLFACVHEGQGVASSGPAPALHRARHFIELHVTNKVDLDAVSRHCGLSKFHLVRMFKEAFGTTPIQYQLGLRIEQAKRLLASRHLTINDVAHQVGYDSVSSFTRAFRRVVGISPGNYRRVVYKGRAG